MQNHSITVPKVCRRVFFFVKNSIKFFTTIMCTMPMFQNSKIEEFLTGMLTAFVFEKVFDASERKIRK